jgi:hypothetical protein
LKKAPGGFTLRVYEDFQPFSFWLLALNHANNVFFAAASSNNFQQVSKPAKGVIAGFLRLCMLRF